MIKRCDTNTSIVVALRPVPPIRGDHGRNSGLLGFAPDVFYIFHERGGKGSTWVMAKESGGRASGAEDLGSNGEGAGSKH